MRALENSIAQPLNETATVSKATTEELASGELLKMLYRQVASLAGPRHDLDDLVQSVAERVIKALPRFRGRCKLSTFTYSIAYRTMVDHDRFSFRYNRRFAKATSEELEARDSGWDIENAALELKRARRLHLALSKLPPKKRAVIVLHELEGLSLKEVAEIVSANDRTVRSRLHDGKKKLLKLLSQDPAFSSEAAK